MDNSTRIKELRKLTGLSQAAFALRFQIPRRTLENWERGVNQCPDYTVELLDFQIKSHRYLIKKEGAFLLANPISILYEKKEQLFQALDKARRMAYKDAIFAETATRCPFFVCLDNATGRIAALDDMGYRKLLDSDEECEILYDTFYETECSKDRDLYGEFTSGWTTDDYTTWLKKNSLPTSIVTDALAEAKRKAAAYSNTDQSDACDSQIIETKAIELIREKIFEPDNTRILEVMAEEAASTLPFPDVNYENIFEGIIRRYRIKYTKKAEEYSIYAKACIEIVNTAPVLESTSDAASQEGLLS